MSEELPNISSDGGPQFDPEEVLGFAYKVLTMPPNKAIAFLEEALGRKDAVRTFKALQSSPAAKILRDQGKLK
jgi:hypothetical protein